MLHQEITRDIIDAAMAVLNELRLGLDERPYENALVIELQTRNRAADQQQNTRCTIAGVSLAKLSPA